MNLNNIYRRREGEDQEEYEKRTDYELELYFEEKRKAEDEQIEKEKQSEKVNKWFNALGVCLSGALVVCLTLLFLPIALIIGMSKGETKRRGRGK